MFQKTLIIITALTILAFASVTSAFADEPAAGVKDELIGNFNFLLEIEGIESQMVTVGGFRVASMDSTKGAIVLEGGYTATDDLWEWRKNIADGIVDKRSGTITILDQDMTTVVARYNFYHAWPCKWYVPDFDAAQSEMAIEKIELAVEKVERVMR